MEDDTYVWCNSNLNYQEAKAFAAWCETIWRLEDSGNSIHIKKITELMHDLYDDLWGDVYDLRELLDENN